MYQSSSSSVLVEQKNGVLRLKLNRPEKLNAMNYELIMAAKEIVSQVGRRLGCASRGF